MKSDVFSPYTGEAQFRLYLRGCVRLFCPQVLQRQIHSQKRCSLTASLQKRRKILFAIDSLTGGGAERVMSQVANDLDPSLYDIQIVLTLGSANVQNIVDRVKIVRLSAQIPEDLYFSRSYLKSMESWAAALFARVANDPAERGRDLETELHNFRIMTLVLGRYVLTWQPDAILSFLPNTNLLTLLARAWYGFQTPIICADHNHLSSELPRLPLANLRKFFVMRHYPSANRHLAVAPEVGEDLIENFRVARSKVVTIPNGIDIERIRLLAAQPLSDAELPSKPGEALIVSVGRLTRQKGYDVLLSALASLRNKLWRLMILGEGEEEAALNALAATLGLSDKVHFLGWKPNPYQWMIRSDLFVLSSRWEAWPIALLEALALELPIVATDCKGATVRILDNGRYGKLVPPDSPDALASAITVMLNDVRLRRSLGSLAGERSADFGLTEMIRRYDQMLSAVIADG